MAVSISLAGTRRSQRHAAYLVLLGTLCLGQLGRIPLIASELKTAPLLTLDLGVGLLWLLLAAYVTRHPEAIRIDRMTFLVMLFAIWGVIGIILTAARYDLSVGQMGFSALYMARWLFYFAVYLWVTTVPTGETAPDICAQLVSAILVFSAFGVFQSAFLPNFAFLVNPDAVPYHTWDIQGHRLVSTFLDPNYAGNLIGVGLLLLLPAILRRRTGMRLSFILLVTALFLTASRGSVGGAALGSAIVVSAVGLRKGVHLLPKFAALLVAVVLLSTIASWATGAPTLWSSAAAFLHDYHKLGITDASALNRLLSWQIDLRLAAMHPITGIGFNTLGFLSDALGNIHAAGNASFGLDGGLLFIAALTGVVGVLLYLAIVGLAIVRGIRIARNPHAPDWARDVGAATAGATVMWIAQGFFVNSLLYPFLMVTYWILWGLVTLAWRQRHTWQAS